VLFFNSSTDHMTVSLRIFYLFILISRSLTHEYLLGGVPTNGEEELVYVCAFLKVKEESLRIPIPVFTFSAFTMKHSQ